MTAKTNILYPVARSVTGRAVHIGEALRGYSYECLGCAAPMVVKQGTKRQWHFAHKPPFERCAEPDKALHDAAKFLIMQGFSDALTGQGNYRLGCPCKDCGGEVSRNIAAPGVTVEPESSIVAGTRSDLVVSQPGKGQVIIEVVVTHDLEPEAQVRYVESGIPVLKVRPTWDTLTELESAVITDDTLNVGRVRCAECKNAEEIKRRRDEENRGYANKILRRMDKRQQTDPASPPFRPWTHDKFARIMYRDIRQQVYANAIILTELGFVQDQRKPWLFVFRLPYGVVYANFGSTEEIAIWKDRSALIHWMLNQSDEEMKRVLVDGVLARCRAAGAEVRVSFYAQMFDRQEVLEETHPVAAVDRTVLNTLLAESDRIYPEMERQLRQKRQELAQERQAEKEAQGRQQAEMEKAQRRQQELAQERQAEMEAQRRQQAEMEKAQRRQQELAQERQAEKEPQRRQQAFNQEAARKWKAEQEEWAQLNKWFQSRRII